MRSILFCALAHLCVSGRRTPNGSFLPVNWTASGTIGENIDSHNHNPAVIPVAPCPCDLTSNDCDIHCCCDQDCKWFTPDVFNCTKGLDDGQASKEGAEYNCANRGPYSPQWFSFLCFEKENNPYLGMYFKFTPKVSTYEEYLSRDIKVTSSFKDDTGFPELTAVIDYKEGSVIQTKSQDSHGEIRSHLTLPMSVTGTYCTGKSVVQFLQNSESSCLTRMSRNSCHSSVGSRLSVASYLQDSLYIEANPDVKFAYVIGNLSSGEVANITMTYNCVIDTRPFLKIQLRGRQSSGLSNVLKDKELDENNCGPDSLPTYNATTDTCDNVVLAVTYEFKWHGSSITGIVGQIDLGSVPLYSDVQVTPSRSLSAPHFENRIYVIQQFSSVFQHDEQIVNTTNEWYDNSSLPNIMERSGNPFYDINRKVLAGYFIESAGTEENDTAELIASVDVTEDTGLYVWKPGPKKLCNETLRTPVMFGVDTLTMCSYALSNLHEDDCGLHISETESILGSLIVGDMVSTIGWPNISSTADFIPILSSADDRAGLVEENTTECRIPVGIEYKVAFRDIDIGLEKPRQYQIVGILVRFHYEVKPLDKEIKVFLKSSVIFVRSKEPSKLSRFWQKMADPHCVGGICWQNLFYAWVNFKNHATYTTSYTVALAELYFQTFFLLFVFIPILYVLFANKHQLSF